MPPKKTLLIGNFGAHNVGDELILLSALRDYPDSFVMCHDELFSQTFTGRDFPVVPFFPTGFRSGCRYLFSHSYRRSLHQLSSQVDRVVFAGGGLLAIRTKAYFIWGMIFWWVRRIFPDAEIRWEYQGVDDPSFLLNKKIVQKVFSQASFFSVRDGASQDALFRLTAKKVPLVGDRVEKLLSQIQLPASRPEKILLVNALRPFDPKEINEKLSLFIQREKLKVVFVAFEQKDLLALPPEFEGNWVFPKTKTELFSLFSQAQYAVGERFHFLLLAHHFLGSEKVWTLRAPYAQKVESLCQKNGIKTLEKKI